MVFSGTSFCSRMFDSGSVGSAGYGGSSGLAAALLDGPAHQGGSSSSHQRPPLTRPTSYSTGEQHHLREKARSRCSDFSIFFFLK